jgi:MOSC domain-containing protein YiiM
MAKKGRLIAVSISSRVGTRKSPVPSGMLRENHGLVGDAHAGTGRQVSLLAEESIAKMQAQGLSVGAGDFAENLTTAGLELHRLPIGTHLRVGGGVTLEITQIGKECHSDCEIGRLTGKCIMPTEGVFVAVRVGGEVKAGDEIEVLESHHEGRHTDDK